MKNLFKGRRKFWMLAPIALMIAAALFFQYAFEEARLAVFQEKLIEKRMNVDLVAATVDRYVELAQNWGEHDYAADVGHLVEEIDKSPRTFAALYDVDLNVLTARYHGEKAFDPIQYLEFTEAVAGGKQGAVTLRKDAPLGLYYRWIPTDGTLENRLLIVVGMTPASVETRLGERITIGAAALIIVTFLLNAALVVLFLKRSGSGVEA